MTTAARAATESVLSLNHEVHHLVKARDQVEVHPKCFVDALTDTQDLILHPSPLSDHAGSLGNGFFKDGAER